MQPTQEKFQAFLRAVTEGDISNLEKVMHMDVAFVFPYALPGTPEVVTGRDRIIDYLTNRKFTSNHLTTIYMESTPSGNIYAEVLAEETFTRTGKTYHQHVICKVKVTEGLIESYREFFNPITRLEGLLNLDIDNLDLPDG